MGVFEIELGHENASRKILIDIESYRDKYKVY